MISTSEQPKPEHESSLPPITPTHPAIAIARMPALVNELQAGLSDVIKRLNRSQREQDGTNEGPMHPEAASLCGLFVAIGKLQYGLDCLSGEWFDAAIRNPKDLDVVLTVSNGYYEVCVFRDRTVPHYSTHRGMDVYPSHWRKLPYRCVRVDG